MKLIIAEKPSLARKITEAIGSMKKEKDYYIGNGYIVTSQFGHLLTLYDIEDYSNDEKSKCWTLESIESFPREFKFKIKPEKSVKDRYKLIKTLIKREDVTEIVNAGDADREGEVLINIVLYKIFDELKITKKISRIWLEDQTKETIQKQLKNLKPIEKTTNLYREGLARTYLDWLYGIYLTRYITLLSHTKYNTGRVIIPTVKFIYDRDMEIRNFKPEPYYEIETIINKNNQDIKLNFKDLRFNKDEIQKALNTLENLKGKEIKVTNVENKQIVKRPNKLFSLPTLQNYMSKTKKFSLDKTLKLVQSLYENNYLTYPRTNTEYMAEEEKDRAKEIIQAINKSNYLGNKKLEFKDTKSIFDSKKVESHSALTPTIKIPNLSTLQPDEQAVYIAVLNRFIANFYPEECILDVTNITFELNNMKTTLRGTSVKQDGYLKYENNLSEKTIPEFKDGEKFIGKFEFTEKETTPPNKVTEAELNKFFEKPFKNYKSTENETEEQTENDDDDYKNILKGIEIGTPATRSETVEKVKNVGYIEANKNILSITDKGIAFIRALEVLHINLYKEKTVELSQNLKRVNLGEISLEEIISMAETEIKGIINQKIDDETSKKIGELEERNIKSGKAIIGKCPICGKEIIENSKAYGCSGYKEGCTFTIWKTIAGKKITKTIATELISKGRTKKISGFKSKAGKSFDASLIIEEGGKITFNF